jgi:hypothetical protein
MHTRFSSEDCPPEVTAETVLSELKHLEYPAIHERQLKRKIFNKNLKQNNALFLPLHAITCTVEEHT